MFNRAGKPAESHLINKAQQLISEVLEITKVDGDVYHTLGLLYLNYGLNLYYNNGSPEIFCTECCKLHIGQDDSFGCDFILLPVI